MMAYMKKHGHRESDMNTPFGNHGKPVTCWKRDCLRESVSNVPFQKDNRRNEYSGMSSRCYDVYTCRSRIARDYKKEAARCKELQSVFNGLQFEWADKSASCTRRERELRRVKNMGVKEYLSHVKTLQAAANNTIDLLRPSGDYNLDAIQSEELHSVFTDAKLLRLYILSKRANEDFSKMEKLKEQGDNSNESLLENEEILESRSSSIKEVYQMDNATQKVHKSKEQYSNVCQRFVEISSDSGESSLSSDSLVNEIGPSRQSRKSNEDPIKLKRIRNFINSRNSCLQETSLSGSVQGGEGGQSSRKNLKLDVYRNESENCTRRRKRSNCRQTILTSIKRNDSKTRLKSNKLQDEKEVSLSKISLSSGICSMKSEQLESSCSGSRCSRTKSPLLGNELSSRESVSRTSTESKQHSWRKDRRLSNNSNVHTGVSVTKSSPEHSTLGFNSSSNSSTLPSTNGTTSVPQSIFSSEYVTVNESLINFEPQKIEPQKNTTKLDNTKLQWIKNALRIVECEDKGIRNNMCENKDKKKDTGRTLGEIPLMERGQVPGYVDVALQRWLAIKRRHIELKHRKSFSNRKVDLEDQKFARRCDKAARRILEELEALILRNGDASPLRSAGSSQVAPPQPDQVPAAWEDTTRTPVKRQRPPRHRSRPSLNYNKYNINNKKENAPPSRSNSAPPKCNLVVRFSSQKQEITLQKDRWPKLRQESSIPPYRPFCPMDLCPFTMTYSEVRPSHEMKEITQGIPDESK